MKKFISIILILTLIGTGGYLASNYFKESASVEDNQNKQEMPPKQQEKTDNDRDKDKDTKSELNFTPKEYTSPQGNFKLQYPQEWYVKEAITSGGRSIFGEILSAWNIASFDFDKTPDRGGIPENSIKIDFEVSIPKEGFELTVITECDLEENTCETREINGITYTRVVKIRGQRPSILYAAYPNEKMYRASAIFGAERGSQQLEEQMAQFDEIAKTFEVVK